MSESKAKNRRETPSERKLFEEILVALLEDPSMSNGDLQLVTERSSIHHAAADARRYLNIKGRGRTGTRVDEARLEEVRRERQGGDAVADIKAAAAGFRLRPKRAPAVPADILEKETERLATINNALHEEEGHLRAARAAFHEKQEVVSNLKGLVDQLWVLMAEQKITSIHLENNKVVVTRMVTEEWYPFIKD